MLELLLVFDLKSVGYNEKEKGQTVISDDLSFLLYAQHGHALKGESP